MTVGASPLSRRSMKLLLALSLVVMTTLPVATAYLGGSVDKTDFVKDGTCYCHGTEPSPEMDIVIRVPTQVAYTPNNRSVTVEVGLLGGPTGPSSFGAFLNASSDPTNVKWQRKFGNGTTTLLDSGTLLKLNGSVVYSVEPIYHRWFNLSFVPGNANQTIVLSVVGMQYDDNGNETGDPWGVSSVTIEVRKQRLMAIDVPVQNKANVAASDVLVDFYIDGEYLGNFTIPHVPENGKENATINWDVTFLKDGKYRLKAVIDPNGIITESNKGNNEVTHDIWLGDVPEETDYTMYYAAGAGIVIVVAVVLFWFYRRRSYSF